MSVQSIDYRLSSVEAFDRLQQWAQTLGGTFTNSSKPLERLKSFAQLVAQVRLQKQSILEEPDKSSVRRLLLDYLESHPEEISLEELEKDEDAFLGKILENFISAAAQHLVEKSENLPYSCCDRFEED